MMLIQILMFFSQEEENVPLYTLFTVFFILLRDMALAKPSLGVGVLAKLGESVCPNPRI